MALRAPRGQIRGSATTAVLTGAFLEELARRHAQPLREIGVAHDAEVPQRNVLDQRQRDRRRHFGFFTSARMIAGLRIHSRLPGDHPKDLRVEVPHRAEGLDLVDRDAARLQDRQADELVGVADQDAALLLAARVGELDLLRHGHGADAAERRPVVTSCSSGSPSAWPRLLLLFGACTSACSSAGRLRGAPPAPPFLFGLASCRLLLVEELLADLVQPPTAVGRQLRVLEERVDQRRLRSRRTWLTTRASCGGAGHGARQPQERLVGHVPVPDDRARGPGRSSLLRVDDVDLDAGRRRFARNRASSSGGNVAKCRAGASPRSRCRRRPSTASSARIWSVAVERQEAARRERRISSGASPGAAARRDPVAPRDEDRPRDAAAAGSASGGRRPGRAGRGTTWPARARDGRARGRRR